MAAYSMDILVENPNTVTRLFHDKFSFQAFGILSLGDFLFEFIPWKQIKNILHRTFIN